MKLVMVEGEKLGVLRDDRTVVDVSAAVKDLPHYPYGQLMKEILANWDQVKAGIEREAAHGTGVSIDEVRFLAPVPKPEKIFCVGINYWEYPTRMELSMMDAFQKNSECASAPDGEILLPPYHDLALQANKFHPEPELAFVIGKTARFVNQNNAMDYVFGYMQSSDFSLRRKNPPQYGNMLTAKSCEGFFPCGPALVTKDEVPDPYVLDIRLEVNGSKSGYNTRDMQHHVPEVVEFLSKVTTLRPGDCISLGNHHHGLQTVMNKDRVTISIDKMGPPLRFGIKDPLEREFAREMGMATLPR